MKIRITQDWEEWSRPYIDEDIDRKPTFGVIGGVVVEIDPEKLAEIKEAMVNFDNAMDFLTELANKAEREAEEKERLENPRTKGDMIRKMAKEQGWEIIEHKCVLNEPADYCGLPFNSGIPDCIKNRWEPIFSLEEEDK
jgi:hypothetical protein